MTPDLSNSPIMIGHDCTQCGASIPKCNEHITKHGAGCCSGCFLEDTHGLLRSLSSAPAELGERLTEVEVQTARMTSLLASFVISRTEHARAIRRLLAQSDGQIESIAKLEAAVEHLSAGLAAALGRIAELERASSHGERSKVRMEVGELDERVVIIERALPEIEAKVGLRRRPQSFTRHKALPPGKQ
jgi:hypothetical protein